MLRLSERRKAVKDKAIERLISLWEPLEKEYPYIKFPNWWKRRKPSKRESPRVSIRTWDNYPDWYRMMGIYWMISGWMHHLSQSESFPYTNAIMRNDALIAAWRLGEYLKLLRDPYLRDFIERLQQLASAIVASIDEDEPTSSTDYTCC